MANINTMQLVEQHIIQKNDPRWLVIDAACFKSKNIYNAANYLIRQQFFVNQTILIYKTIEKHFKLATLLDDQRLPLKVVQQTLKRLCDDWKGYKAARKGYKKHPEKFTGCPRIPRYKPKTEGRFMLVYTAQALDQVELKQGMIKPSGLAITIQTHQKRINQVRIVPRKDYYVVEVVYTTPIQPAQGLNPEWVAGGDLGVDNLLALTSNKPGFVPLLVNGRPLKNINHSFNQRLAELKSRLPKNQFTSRLINIITENRNRRIQYELHTLSRRLIDHIVAEQIGVFVIGKNVGWKQGLDIGKRNNQNFVQIPHARFIDMLTYKARLVGIEVIVTEESYTSKCSFLDNEPVEKHETYVGKRIKRGLFRSASGQIINADVNGSYNILRKAVPKAFANGIGAAVVQPVRV